MAEGFAGSLPTTQQDAASANTRTSALSRLGAWLFGTRTRQCLSAAALAFASLATVAGIHLFSTPILTTADSIAWFVAASGLLWLPLLLLLLDPADNMARGPGIVLPLTTLAVLTGLAAFVVMDRVYGLGILRNPQKPDIAHPTQIAVFLSLLAVAFIPRVWNALLFARYKEQDRKEREAAAAQRALKDAGAQARANELEGRQRDQDDAEALSALIATITVGGIGLLAWLAAGWSQGEGLRNVVGIGIAAFVVSLFTIVIFLDWIAEMRPVRAAARGLRGISRRMGWLAAFYNAIDTALVRIGAHVAGTEHHKTRSRYVILGGTLGSLAIMAWQLPAPFGLIPAIMGFILAFSVSRLWSWVEEDRNLASITRFNPETPKRIGFREDFRDETLLGFIFVLILVPISLMQADSSQLFGQPLFKGEGKSDLSVWFGYFGFELAKALPVVDWADIYRLQPGKDLLQPAGTIGMHAVFAARVMVDIALIASLLQAISIATRNRQQKALYAAGHITRLDELVEKEELARATIRRRTEWYKGPVDFRRYDETRLKEIYSSTDSLRYRTFIEEIFHQSGRTLDPAMAVLERMSHTHRNESDLYLTFDAVKREHNAAKPSPVGDLEQILENLRTTYGLQSLKAEIMKFAAIWGSPAELLQLGRQVMFGARADKFQYARLDAAQMLSRVADRLPDHLEIDETIRELDASRKEAFGANQPVADALRAALVKRLDELRPDSPENKP